MITATTSVTPRTASVPVLLPQEPARVSFVPPGPGRHRLDGAWWPRSRDLPGELPALVDALDQRFGRVSRVTVNNSMWPEVPRRVAVKGRTIHAGWFGAEQDPHTIYVLDDRGGRWSLLVVPPTCEDIVSARLMGEASRPGNRRAASDLVTAAPSGGTSESVWESEGGQVAAG